MNKAKTISQDELKSNLNYDEKTGIFTWNLKKGNKQKGDIAGCTTSNNCYCMIMVNGKSYLAHRLAWLYMYGYLPTKQIDHINCVRTDNRIINLRESTQHENMLNINKRANNSSGYKGVSKSLNKWMARASINYKDIYLGTFDTAEKAYEAYVKFANDNHGEFANV